MFFLLFYMGGFIPPIFMKLKFNTTGEILYKVYSIFCHQMPDRAIYIGGKKLLYSENEMISYGYSVMNSNDPVRINTESRKFYGNEEMGYKLGYCVRDWGIYTGIIFTLILIIVVNFNFSKIYLPIRIFLLIPMIVDGIVQLVSAILFYYSIIPEVFYESTNILRIITGLLFGIGFSLLCFPFIKEE